MARLSTTDRRRQIGDAALRAFSETGFRLTQVADIAKLAGTAPGTLYLYAPSKEALFVMAMERSLGEEPQEAVTDPAVFAEVVLQKLLNARSYPRFMASVDGAEDPMAGPDVVFAEIFDSVDKLAPTIRLIERCAQDWPELAALFYENLRPTLLRRLETYLAKGVEQGTIRKPPNFQLAARLIVETIAWFAMHRHGDVDGRFYDPAAVRTATLDALIHAYATKSTEEVKR